MEHLDLAGYLPPPTNWNFGALEQEDAAYLANSRSILETIVEETSEDEECAERSWAQHERGASSFWSSAESETGSVIRVEIHKDVDSLSERAFACPPKRARRAEDLFTMTGSSQPNSLEDNAVQLRRPQRASYELDAAHEPCPARDSLNSMQSYRSSASSRRFDEFYSDNESYHSLSRSSSLVQFESLERQLVLSEQHASMGSLGNSSPSLLSFEATNSAGNSGNNSGNNSCRGSQSSLMKRYESSDGRLHQTYFELNKLSFDEEHRSSLGACKSLPNESSSCVAELKSDSECSSSSTTSSSSRSGKSILTASKPSAEDLTADAAHSTRISAYQTRGKNSAENLSEDSGYGEPPTLRSWPKNFEKFCEEEEEFQQPSVATCDADDSKNICQHSKILNESPSESEAPPSVANDLCQPKINDDNHRVESSASAIANANVEMAGDGDAAAATASVGAVDFINRQPTCAVATEDYDEYAHHRSLAHSPSPVSSVSSELSTSSSSNRSSCGSAASFTWLPARHQRNTVATASASVAAAAQSKALAALGACSAVLRSSLPDIRVAYGSENSFKSENSAENSPQFTRATAFIYSSALDPSKDSEAAVGDTQKNTSATSPATSSASSSSSSYFSPLSPTAVQSDATASETDDETESNAETVHSVASPYFLRRNQRLAISIEERDDYVAENTNTSYRISRSDSDDDEDVEVQQREHEFGDFDSQVLRRCDSWASRRSRDREPLYSGSSFGYMNASYQDLTQLDLYDDQEQDSSRKSNLKRSANEAEMAAQRSDDDEVICKGNFLLDELSQIYDRNVSILNEKSKESPEDQADLKAVLELNVNSVIETVTEAPKPLPRHLKNVEPTQPSETEYGEVQHVQLTIRHAPEPGFQAFNKTFDQDPTNLRTSYAQSLEKCNFDNKELSLTDLSVQRPIPKRRFQSHASAAKERSLVSSTPNLNAFDPKASAELDDDLCVSSAHTSMHQLPQAGAPKPLGILLPAGSRVSFGKEVSFCPVVSKYCWQEQSSEECTESTEMPESEKLDVENSKIVVGLDESNASRSDNDDDDDDDDELLDNTDATVIQNTKENEFIAALYNLQHSKAKIADHDDRSELREQEQQSANESEKIGAEQEMKIESVSELKRVPVLSDVVAADCDRERLPAAIALAHKPVSYAESQNKVNREPIVAKPVTITNSSLKAPAAVEIASRTENVNTTVNTENDPNSSKSRPLSLQLPILSEPPVNRAHQILYASQQLLDRFEARERDREQEEQPPQQADKMSAAQHESQCNYNNNNYNNNNSAATAIDKKNSMKSKLPKTDEKHPSSKGFLARFAHGFRFSLRRKKNKPDDGQPKQQSAGNSNGKKSGSNGLAKKSATPDIIHIPLKGPLPGASPSSSSSGYGHDSANLSSTTSSSEERRVTGKPPLPKQPPRAYHGAGAVPMHAHSGYVGAGITPAQHTKALLDSECCFYDDFKNQLTSSMQQRQLVAANGYCGGVASPSELVSPSRATVAQKTQMFNQLGEDAGAGKVRVVPPVNRIGLIETNLDTQETIVSGKTRSLMDIAGPQHQRYGMRRLNATTSGHYGQCRDSINEHCHIGGDDECQHIGDDEDDNVALKTPAQGNGAQIASVRRPHKSMEFLLDKENQRNVLPPENELQKSHEHNAAALSEHQLRVQASLQRLNIPEWYRQYNQNNVQPSEQAAGASTGYKPGNFARKRAQESGRWAGLNSKTTSLSSLGSQRSDRSPLLLSPSAHSHHGGQSAPTTANYYSTSTAANGANQSGGAFSRWSTSHLNSNQTSPSISQRSSFSRGGPINSSFMSVASGNNSAILRSSYRQPYLGWRSQEKLSQRTPHERLASSLLAQQQRAAGSTSANVTATATAANTNGSLAENPAVTPEIQSSIKEVTSAIVHYVNDKTAQQQQLQQQSHRSRSTSPNSSYL